jgi:hypothetical protein
MKDSFNRLVELFRRDFLLAPAELALAAVLGWSLLLPASGPDLPVAGAVLLLAVLVWLHVRTQDTRRPSRLAIVLALLPLGAALYPQGLPWPIHSWLALPCAVALLPLVVAGLPPLGRGQPRPLLAQVLLPVLTPLMLGTILLLAPGVPRQTFLLTLMETLQLCSLLVAGSLLLVGKEEHGAVARLLVGAKCLSTLLLPWWLLHSFPDHPWAWLVAVGLIIEGEWESRLLLQLADRAAEC